MEKYCRNCGNYGHFYKSCRHPILSYGILLYSYEGKIPKIVMIERKDSLSYIEFLRGKYKTIQNYEYIKLLISRMTIDERGRLLEFSFDELWKNLWIHTDSVNTRIQNEYIKSKEHFNLLKQGITNEKQKYNLETIIDELKDTVYASNEWEIPKGRRKNYENNKECAIREFEEETNIEYVNYKLINNIIPLLEEYKGINDVRYKHIYYIGYIDHLCELKINMENRDQYTEIKNIKWLTEEECYQHIRHYDENKKKIIQTFFKFINDDLKKELTIK